MLEFREFGNTFVVIDKLFVCERDPEGGVVTVYSDRGAPVDIRGDDAREFMIFVRKKIVATDEGSASLIYAPQTAPRPTPDATAKKSVP